MKEMRAKYAGRCKVCGTGIEVGAAIFWSRDSGALCSGGCVDVFWGNSFGRREAEQHKCLRGGADG